MKIVTSLSAHESELALLDQCFNYFHVGDVDAIVVHINPYSAFSRELFLRLVHASPFADRIFVNSFATGDQRVSKKYVLAGSVLHRAHISNFQFMDALVDFDIFCLDASNTLLLKTGLRQFCEAGEAIQRCVMNPQWIWSEDVNTDAALRFFGESLCVGQHEGSVYARDSMRKMVRVVLAYERALAQQEGRGEGFAAYPREEIVLPSAYNKAVGGDPRPEPYVYISVERDIDLHWSVAQVDEVLSGKAPLPEMKYSIKRVPRDMNDSVRIHIGNYFGYRPQIAGIVAGMRRMR